MNRLFLDTSALVKRYIVERGTDDLQTLLNDADELILSAICIPEVVSALSRLKREKKINKGQFNKLKKYFYTDLEDCSVCEIGEDVLSKSLVLLESFPLKTLDSIHLATAALEKPQTFVSCDQQQIRAAKRIGLNCAALG